MVGSGLCVNFSRLRKVFSKEFKGNLRRHLGKDIAQLKASLDWDYVDFLLNDLLAEPDGLDCIVFASRSELRRWSSGQN